MLSPLSSHDYDTRRATAISKLTGGLSLVHSVVKMKYEHAAREKAAAEAAAGGGGGGGAASAAADGDDASALQTDRALTFDDDDHSANTAHTSHNRMPVATYAVAGAAATTTQTSTSVVTSSLFNSNSTSAAYSRNGSARTSTGGDGTAYTHMPLAELLPPGVTVPATAPAKLFEHLDSVLDTVDDSDHGGSGSASVSAAASAEHSEASDNESEAVIVTKSARAGRGRGKKGAAAAAAAAAASASASETETTTTTTAETTAVLSRQGSRSTRGRKGTGLTDSSDDGSAAVVAALSQPAPLTRRGTRSSLAAGTPLPGMMR